MSSACWMSLFVLVVGVKAADKHSGMIGFRPLSGRNRANPRVTFVLACTKYAWRVCQGSFYGVSSFQAAWVTPGSCAHPPAQPPAHLPPALVAHAQGGLTLGPERGELAADFWDLGFLGRACTRPGQSCDAPVHRTSSLCTLEKHL
jgi:hypothetical protein